MFINTKQNNKKNVESNQINWALFILPWSITSQFIRLKHDWAATVSLSGETRPQKQLPSLHSSPELHIFPIWDRLSCDHSSSLSSWIKAAEINLPFTLSWGHTTRREGTDSAADSLSAPLRSDVNPPEVRGQVFSSSPWLLFYLSLSAAKYLRSDRKWVWMQVRKWRDMCLV